jgi:hypothetical protein
MNNHAVDQKVHQNVGHILDEYGIAFRDVEFDDDPPGKLQALNCLAKCRNVPVRVIIKLRYSKELFSAERKWREPTVRAAHVESVETSPTGSRCR